jgi:hypothetical protein
MHAQRINGTVVRSLRRNKLKSGRPFMINSNELPAGQCYIEYPNGSIQMVRLSDTGRDFVTIKLLTTTEQNQLRKKFQLI